MTLYNLWGFYCEGDGQSQLYVTKNLIVSRSGVERVDAGGQGISGSEEPYRRK